MLFLTMLFSAVAAAETTADPVDEYLARFAERRAELHALRADLVERTILPEDTFVSTGRVTYIRPRRLIREMQDPESTILVDQNRAYLYEPEITQVQIFDIEQGPEADILFLGFDDDIRNLREAYDVRLLTHENEHHGLLLTPKFDPDRDPLFREVSIFFTERDFLPYEIRVLQDEGAQTIYEVSNFEINPPLDPAETQMRLPAGTTIIENDRVRGTVEQGGQLMPAALQVGETGEASRQPQPGRLDMRELEPLVPESAALGAEAGAEAE